MEFERGVFTLKKTGRCFKPLKESQPIRIKQTQRAPTEGASDNKGKVYKYDSELEKEFTWLIYDAKAQLLFCQQKQQKRVNQTFFTLWETRYFKELMLKNTTLYACAATFELC